MCNRDCCAMKTALDLRRQKILMEKMRLALLANPPKTIETPQSQIYTYDEVLEIAKYIIKTSDMRPKYGIIVGSTLSDILELIENRRVIDYEDIPNYPPCCIAGEVGAIYMGTIMGAPVMAFLGRCHVYEGYPIGTCCMPVQVMKLCGVEYLFLSCSSGAVHMDYEEGDILLIKDHINMIAMLGNSPLQGPNEKRFGSRHPRMIGAYDRQMLKKAVEIGQEIGYEDKIHTGVYACLGGPFYETPTEQLMLRTFGVDAVGMAVVNEVVVARHCGLKVFAFSLILKTAVDHPKSPPRGLEKGQQACIDLVAHMIYYIENGLLDTPLHYDKLIEDRKGYNLEDFWADIDTDPKGIIINEDEIEMEDN